VKIKSDKIFVVTTFPSGWLINIKTVTELYNYVVKTGEMNFLVTFKMSQDPLENFFSSVRMSCGNNNNPTAIQFRSAFQSLLCGSLNKNDNGNAIFEDTLPVIELSSVCLDWNCNLDKLISNDNQFVENVIIYISGFIMRTLMKKEKCLYCYTFLHDSPNRISCTLIDVKQLGGLIHPLSDLVSVVDLANRNVKLYYK
jgi:hypothetical protein